MLVGVGGGGGWWWWVMTRTPKATLVWRIICQVTPKCGYEHYANYQSCNAAAGQPGGYLCASILPTDCSILGVSNCFAAGNSKYSKDHVGMGVVRNGGGRWY